MRVIFLRMPCQSMGRYICRYPHAAEIFAEYTEAADPVGMIRRTFIAAFLAPMIAEFLGKSLFGKLMLAEKRIDPEECGNLCFIFESQGLFQSDQSAEFIPKNAVESRIIHKRSPVEPGRTPKAFSDLSSGRCLLHLYRNDP